MINVIVPIMAVAAVFQLTDGLQTTLGGVYKGIKKTKFILIANFLAYAVVGISLGTYLGMFKEMYLYGCWVGICVSSILLTTLLAVFLIRTLKKLRV